jgi:capsular exopolysaccharide synthesis family protein
MRTVLVTSSVAGEGKTFVTSNLARAMVRQTDRRVLVIDGDLRCPRMHVALGASQAPGLTDYLRGTAEERAIIQRGKKSALYFIASGTRVSDPSELLSNGRFKAFMTRMAAMFDWILVDSPPCLPVADPGVIADCCDGVLLVVKAGSTASALVARARQELNGRNVAGVVMNAVKQESFVYGAYYGSGYGNSAHAASAAAR